MVRRLRVALLSHRYPPVYSGPGRATEALAVGLSRLGAEATVLTLSPDDPPHPSPAAVKVVRFRSPFAAGESLRISFPVGLWFDLRCALWLLAHRKTVDVVQSMSMPTWTFWLLLRTARALQKPLFARVTMLGGDDLATIRRSRLGSVRAGWCAQIAGVVAMTPELASEDDDAANVVVLPKYVDGERFAPAGSVAEREAARAAVGVAADEYAVLFVGSLSLRKGIDLVVECFAALARSLPSARLHLLGPVQGDPAADGTAFAQQLGRRIHELGLEGRVVLAGLQADTAPFYRAADVFLFPSRHEGVPSALLEAMASGLPTILCRQPWLSGELAVDLRCGRVVEPDAATLSEALLWMHGHPEEAGRLGRAGRRFVCENHGLEATVGRLVAVYESALAAGHRESP